jgi:protein-tyrosine phosphatase
MPEAKPFRILFVCWGNICRSPAAEGVMRHLVEKCGRSEQIICDSAGTMDMHTGKSPDQRMRQTAKARGIVLDSRAREIQSDDFHTFDLILTMDEKNRSDVMRRYDTQKSPTAKVQMFCDYAQNHDLTEVPDPYYGGQQGFELVMDLLEDGCSHLLQSIA